MKTSGPRKWRAAVACLCLGLGAARASSPLYEVATNGTATGPVYSLAAALELSRQTPGPGPDRVRLRLHGGTYELEQPLVLTQKDSGLTIEAAPHENPVLSGRAVITGWTRSPANPNVWRTQLASVREGRWNFHELFFNGRRRERPRLPARGYFSVVGAGDTNHPTELEFHPGDLPPDLARTGDAELVSYQAWAQTRNQVRSVLPGSNIVSLAGKALANQAEANCRYFIDNAPMAVQPGQWRADLASGWITYWPGAREDMARAVISAPRLYDLVRVEGEAAAPAHDITFRGLTFADADWRLDGGADLDIQAGVEIPGAVRLRFAKACAFAGCQFRRLGGYALELGEGCEADRIVGNEMSDLGGGGVRVGTANANEAAAHPCVNHLITDNHIHNIGLVNAPAVGIFILLSSGNDIAHNEVDHTFYTAVSVGWSWGYGPTFCRSNIVEYNHLHDIGQGMLSDMGGVYTLGLQPGAIIRNNLIHDVSILRYGGWGLYTDEGSTGITLESNVVYHCQSAGFHQHYGRDNIIRNNIFAYNKDAQLVRTRVENHRAFVFTNNIVYFNSGVLLGGKWGHDLEMDHNIYFCSRPGRVAKECRKQLSDWRKFGFDLHSLYLDPLFVNPLKLDFHLRPQSPALIYGFHPLDAEEAGVRAPYR